MSEAYDPSAYLTAASRNFRSSSRLRLQHQLWKSTTTTLLDTTITCGNRPGQPLNVADLGCGNGVWLIDLYDELSDHAGSFQAEGYDINAANFPSPKFLPESIRLNKLDVLSKQLPDDIIGTFDVVHIRDFSSFIINNDTKPVLSTVMALLKPGGWLQWEEMGADFVVETALPRQWKCASETMARLMKEEEDKRGMKLDFVREFREHFSDAGFNEIFVHDISKLKQDYQGWSDNFLMIWEEAASFQPLTDDGTPGTTTRDFWEKEFMKAVDETRDGVVLHRGYIRRAIGRKPLLRSSKSLS
ncbi:hypothetical protein F5Y07DRAFT_408785 [Xylaria sp. FL0933]|nr:hypothetical protein F5Y07DRAFT_408785 [Xylaria sp. FL0933]